MYRKKDDLMDLIQSMTPAEKRNFKILSRSNADASIYLDYFDSLVKGKEFSANNMSPQAETTCRRLLYKNLLKSLRIVHYKRDEQSLQSLIDDVEILYDKNLPEQSLRFFKKSKRDSL